MSELSFYTVRAVGHRPEKQVDVFVLKAGFAPMWVNY
jgi:hypothetical protein